VPGWFSDIDLRLFVELDRIQKDNGITGDILEIGAYCGKSAILLGHLIAPGERLLVCDLFNENERTSSANREENDRWYEGFRREDFENHYLRFHASLPELLVCPSTEIDRDALGRELPLGTYRR